MLSKAARPPPPYPWSLKVGNLWYRVNLTDQSQISSSVTMLTSEFTSKLSAFSFTVLLSSRESCLTRSGFVAASSKDTFLAGLGRLVGIALKSLLFLSCMVPLPKTESLSKSFDVSSDWCKSVSLVTSSVSLMTSRLLPVVF